MYEGVVGLKFIPQADRGGCSWYPQLAEVSVENKNTVHSDVLTTVCRQSGITCSGGGPKPTCSLACICIFGLP